MSAYYADLVTESLVHLLYLGHFIHILFVQGLSILPTTIMLLFKMRRVAIKLRSRIDSHLSYLRCDAAAPGVVRRRVSRGPLLPPAFFGPHPLPPRPGSRGSWRRCTRTRARMRLQRRTTPAPSATRS